MAFVSGALKSPETGNTNLEICVLDDLVPISWWIGRMIQFGAVSITVSTNLKVGVVGSYTYALTCFGGIVSRNLPRRYVFVE